MNRRTTYEVRTTGCGGFLVGLTVAAFLLLVLFFALNEAAIHWFGFDGCIGACFDPGNPNAPGGSEGGTTDG